MPSALFYLYSLDKSISYIRGVWLAFIIIIFVEISELNANAVDTRLKQVNVGYWSRYRFP